MTKLIYNTIFGVKLQHTNVKTTSKSITIELLNRYLDTRLLQQSKCNVQQFVFHLDK